MELQEESRTELLNTLTIQFVMKQKGTFTIDDVTKNVKNAVIRKGHPYDKTYDQEVSAALKNLVFARVVRVSNGCKYSLIKK